MAEPEKIQTEAANQHLSSYDLWNLKLLHTFFDPSSAQQEVFLHVDPDVLDQLGQSLGGDAGLLQAVTTRVNRFGIESDTRGLVSSRRIASERALVSDRLCPETVQTYGPNYPRYLPTLAALVRTLSVKKGGFYETLTRDLKLRHGFGSQELAQLEMAWDDLANWTIETDGRFGLFHVRQLGGYSRISFLQSQSIFTTRDKELFPWVFIRSRLQSGQRIDSLNLQQIYLAAKENAELFSAGLTQALTDETQSSDFRDALISQIRTLYLDWDGSKPLPKQNPTRAHRLNEPNHELKLGLSVRLDQVINLSPVLEVEAVEDHGNVSVVGSTTNFSGTFNGTENIFCACESPRSFWEELAGPSDDIIQFDIKTDNGTTTIAQVEKKPLWVFVPVLQRDGTTLLQQSDLPASGAAYVLALDQFVDNLMQYLVREEPKYEFVPANGLPAGAKLVCLPDCSKLSEEQRLLPDGSPHARPHPHPIKLTGGRAIQRPEMRLFFPYDLPEVEVASPNDYELSWPDSIKLTPVDKPEQKGLILEDIASHQIRPNEVARFEIELQDPSVTLIELKARSILLDKEYSLRLRLHNTSSIVLDADTKASIDKFGKVKVLRDGLSGMVFGEHVSNEFLNTNQCFTALETASVFDPDSTFLQSPAVLFLDRLSASGRLSVSKAREILQRYLSNASSKTPYPFVLKDLWERGHLEIEQTANGRTTYIHAVKPTFYKTYQQSSQEVLFGLAGTISLAFWKSLSRLRVNGIAYPPSDSGLLSATVFKLPDNKEIIDQLNVQISEHAAAAIADWVSNIQDVTEHNFYNPLSSIGSSITDSEVFYPPFGHFRAFTEHSKHWPDLLKVQDREVKNGRAYVLSRHSEQEESRHYAFVPDRSWAIWHALGQCALYVKNTFGLESAYPFPLHYLTGKGELWVPGRLGFPLLVTRALVSASGKQARVNEMIISEEKPTSDERIRLVDRMNPSRNIDVISTYQDMAEGKWLSFDSVPHSVSTIAIKLNCSLIED